MLLTLERIWAKVQEFIGRVDRLEVRSGKTQGNVEHLERKVELLEKGMRHQEKIQDHHGKQLAEAQQQIKKLHSEKQGKAISAGLAKRDAIIAKKELEKLREQLKGPPKDPKKRH